MKKLYTLAITSAVALSLAGCVGGSNGLSPADAAKINPKEVCSIKANGIETVIANAKSYNADAIKEKVEFRRLGVNNSDLIIAVEEGIKAGAKEIEPKDFKGKPSKQKFELNYAAERACKFALSALIQKHEAENEWRLAVPGDGFKY